jgi:hypothetical protein
VSGMLLEILDASGILSFLTMEINNMNSPKKTTADILAYINALKHAEANDVDLAPRELPEDVDVLAPHIVANNNARVVGGDFFSGRRDCINDGSRETYRVAATLLKDKGRSKEFNTVAPMALDDCHVNPIFVSHEAKPLAPSADEPGNEVAGTIQNKVAADLPCFSADEKNKINAVADDVPPEIRAAEDAGYTRGPEVDLENPNPYRIRADHFDNGKRARNSRWRTKMACTKNPGDGPADEVSIYANYWARFRDWRKDVRRSGYWNSFYEGVEATYDKLNAHMKSGTKFTINPMVATLKMPNTDPNEANWDMLPYTAAICWQEQGKPVTIYLVYEAFAELIELDVPFTKSSEASKLYARGIYRDPARAHEEANKDSLTNFVRRGDLFRK